MEKLIVEHGKCAMRTNKKDEYATVQIELLLS